MWKVRREIGRTLGILIVTVLAGCTAPSGYHYAALGTELVPNDPCMSAQVSSARTIKSLNAKAGNPGGPPSAVLAIRDPRAPRDIAESPQDLLCHATLAMRDGKTQAGLLSLTNRGRRAPMMVSWQSDKRLSEELETQENQPTPVARAGEVPTSCLDPVVLKMERLSGPSGPVKFRQLGTVAYVKLPTGHHELMCSVLVTFPGDPYLPPTVLDFSLWRTRDGKVGTHWGDNFWSWQPLPPPIDY